MPKVQINGINIYYEIHGDGEPVVLANGIFMNTTSWFGQISEFSKHFKIILYDMRGQGQSDKPDEEYSFDLHADDQLALLDHLGIEKVHHVGISYGAELGLVFALNSPERLSSLVLSNCASHIGPLLEKIGKLWRYACVKNDPEMFYYATVPFNFSESFISKNQKFFEEALERYKMLNLPSFIYLLDAFLKLDVTNRLSEITVPTLIVGGKKDILKPPDPYSYILHEKINNSEIKIIDDAGHALTHEKPEEFNSEVLRFLLNKNA